MLDRFCKESYVLVTYSYTVDYTCQTGPPLPVYYHNHPWGKLYSQVPVSLNTTFMLRNTTLILREDQTRAFNMNRELGVIHLIQATHSYTTMIYIY